MPYETIDSLPDFVKKMPAKKMRQWQAVWTSAYSRCTKNGGDAKACETRAFKQANAVTHGAGPEPDPEPVPALDPVAFSDAGPLYADDDEVLRTGLLFRAGDFPDKAFSMTADELAAAVEAFTAPVPVDLEHRSTVLDGKLGEVVALDAVGDELHGTVRLPRWLDDAIGTAPRKVSATWDRTSKTLQGLALVLEPRVEDAALLSSYTAFAAARHDTPHGRMALQELHDMAARSGAVCKATNATMASSHENAAIQSIHDMAVSHGAACSALKAGTKPGYPMFGSESGATPAGKERSRMSDKFAQFLAWLNGEESPAEGAAQVSAQTPVATTPVGMTTKADPTAEALRQAQERAAQFEAENRRLRAERIQADAIRFADDQIREGRAFPAEREQIIAAFTQAASDDANYGTVTFGDGSTGDRVSIVRKSYEARPKHQLDMERITPELSALFNQLKTEKPGEGKPDRARVNELIGMTAFGAEHLRHKNGSN